MDETQKAHVRRTFDRIAPIADQAGLMLYDNIFAIDPDLRRLFKIDIETQGRKIMAVVATAVAHLDRLDEVMPTVRELGRKHVAYGVGPREYEIGGVALLKTLDEALGDDFTPEVRDAWAACYEALTGAMKAAAAEVAAPAAADA